ncbi:winged helix-turn-helix domain-containing protein [Ferruginivarius sediminum]|jgi:restriction endonuclease Mrr|uniref:Restriction system protein Mrr-like N-terminal domain-containing protein n=1 Tax=Ferruginivarius sediminum TaxID=2661937 RepID=A0A369TIV7_9PROT|nr:winged helix-turn-helix domain-containing protein [Ferruginivarius sediminum]RDD62816.1 hypothetical protein DRB17_06570 [Ferruginivarius sediminum]
MEFEEYPLLHYADLMHTLLKTAESGPASLNDAAARLRRDLSLARENPPISGEEMRERLARARRYLAEARLVEDQADGRYRVTDRGRQVLREHPGGIDDSVLAAFPEFRNFIARTSGGPAQEARMTVYDSGHMAYRRGAGVADNPYPFDSAEHLAWENGWFEARDEDADNGYTPRG